MKDKKILFYFLLGLFNFLINYLYLLLIYLFHQALAENNFVGTVSSSELYINI